MIVCSVEVRYIKQYNWQVHSSDSPCHVTITTALVAKPVTA